MLRLKLKRWGGNEPLRLLSAARRALERHKLVLIPNDKEPGLSLLSFSDVQAAHRGVLGKAALRKSG